MTTDDIKKLDYSEIVGILDERNRPSGGIKTIQEVCLNSFIKTTSKVLEIGSNTGFTSVNINLLTGSEVTGVDINEISIKNALNYEQKTGASVEFVTASATSLPFPDSQFDMVWASNVTSFISDKSKALSEYSRVLNYRGYLVLVPIYYTQNPPQEILDSVSQAINSQVEVRDKNHWLEMVSDNFADSEEKFELTYSSDYIYLDQEDRYILLREAFNFHL